MNDQDSDRPDHPGVVAPPPLIYGIGVVVGIGLDLLWPLGFVPASARFPAAAVLIGFGVLIALFALPRFARQRTSVVPHKPTTSLITSGPYRLSRNPLYVALTAFHLGIAMALDNLWVVILLVPVLAVMRLGVVSREERYLEAKFGDDYRSYKAAVRRWI